MHCLALGDVGLTSPASKMPMQVIASVAEFERDLLIERTAGKKFGRPSILNSEESAIVMKQLAAGKSVSELVRDYKIIRQTILRTKEKAILL